MTVLFCIFLSLLPVPAALHAADGLGYPVSWDAVPGAGGYLVEVRGRSNRPVYARTVKENRIDLNLSPGSYFFRVTTLNRFMRNESSTPWMAFQIRAFEPPVLLAVVPSTVLTGKAQTLTLKADRLSAEASAAIVSPSGSEIRVRVARRSQFGLQLDLPPLSEEGGYTLVLTNPPDLAASTPAAFHARYPDPFIAGLQPESVRAGGDAHALTLKGGNFSPLAAVFLDVDGKDIELPSVSRNSANLVVSLPASLAPGKYRLFVRNTPDAAGVGSPVLTVLAPELWITRLEPDRLPADRVPATLRLYGGGFSAQATVSLTLDGNRVDLPVVSRSPEELRVDLPSGIAPGDYPLTVYNFRDASGVKTPLLHVLPIPSPSRAKEHLRDLLVSGSWNYLFLFSRWADLYSSSPKGADIGVDFYFTPDRIPRQGASINLGGRISGQYAAFSNDTDVFFGSSLSMYSISLAPSVELAFSFLKMRLYCGGGVVYSRIEGGDSEGGERSADSLDLLAMTRFAVDVPLTGFLRAQLAAEYRHYFLTEPLDALSLSTGLAVVFPYF